MNGLKHWNFLHCVGSNQTYSILIVKTKNYYTVHLEESLKHAWWEGEKNIFKVGISTSYKVQWQRIAHTHPYLVFPESRRASMAVTWASVKSGQFLSFSRMAESEFWMYVPSRLHTMLPRMSKSATPMLKPVMPYCARHTVKHRKRHHIWNEWQWK